MSNILDNNVQYTWVYWNNETNNEKSSSTRDLFINLFSVYILEIWLHNLTFK